MRNITDILARYLSDINLPSVSIIDIIEIILITFFVYQFMVWIKFTRAYTLLKCLLVIGAFLIIAYIFKMNIVSTLFTLTNIRFICRLSKKSCIDYYF